MDLNLKQLLMREDIQKNMKGNFGISQNELDIAIDKTLKLDIPNITSVNINTSNYGLADFENTLHIDTDRNLYFLESRLFCTKNDSMVNAYLEILNNEGDIIRDCIDDVWDYANWEIKKPLI